MCVCMYEKLRNARMEFQAKKNCHNEPLNQPTAAYVQYFDFIYQFHLDHVSTYVQILKYRMQ